MASTASTGFVTPGTSRGLLSVFDYHYLLWRLVRKEVLIRYRGSVLGWIWSFAKPGAQFLVYWLAMDFFLHQGSQVEAYPIYLFSGMALTSFFSETFGNATRSLTDNAALIQKIYLPRELFPVSSVIVALINFLPQAVILAGVCLVVGVIHGWHLTVLSVLAILVAIVIVGILALGLGLLFGAINVAFRDAQNFVDLILMIAMWASPVLYQASPMYASGAWWTVLYRLNPITPAVELMHYGFWGALLDPAKSPIPDGVGFTWYTLAAFLTSLIVLLIGQLVFRRLEGRFAQDL